MSVKFNDGIATAQDIRIDGPAAKLTLTGTASVPAREYDFKGIASLNPATNGTGGFELPFVIQGPWDDPLIFPRSRKPDPPVAGRGAFAGCGEGSQDPRRRTLGDRALYGRAQTGAGSRAG